MTPAEKRATLIAYLRLKADECDWHGVCDAANDLRELEARHRYLAYLRDASEGPENVIRFAREMS